MSPSQPIRVTVWNENRHEKQDPAVASIYPQGIHRAIAGFLNSQEGIKAQTATLDEPEHGLPDTVLEATDVLLWWGHLAHQQVNDEVAEKVYRRVLDGMGLIALHSANSAKPFRKLMGTSCTARWREAGEKNRLWVVAPAHPIVAGLGDYFEIPQDEMYGEYFDIPRPDELIFISWFQGGEVFRSGCCWQRGRGKIFYFQPGHETFPIFHQAEVQQVLINAVRWAAPVRLNGFRPVAEFLHVPAPLDPLATDSGENIK
jgi:trehalose utilization protein